MSQAYGPLCHGDNVYFDPAKTHEFWQQVIFEKRHKKGNNKHIPIL